jgi:hypothetical protein
MSLDSEQAVEQNKRTSDRLHQILVTAHVHL